LDRRFQDGTARRRQRRAFHGYRSRTLRFATRALCARRARPRRTLASAPRALLSVGGGRLAGVGRCVLTLAALWIALSIVAIGVGSTLLRALNATPSGRVADELFFAWWTGIAALAWASFALANVAPLRDAMPWLAAGSLLLAVWSLWHARDKWLVLRPAAGILFVALAILLAERSVALGNLE